VIRVGPDPPLPPGLRLIASAAAAAGFLAVAEVVMLALRYPVAGGDLLWVLAATVALGLVAAAALVVVELPLVLWAGPARTVVAIQRWPPLRYGLGAALLLAALAGHWINATAYVRLYLSLHMGLSLLSLLAAQLAFIVLIPPGTARGARAQISRHQALAVGAALLAWMLLFAASLHAVMSRHELRLVATERAVLLAHQLILLDAATGVLAPEALDGEASGAQLAQLAPRAPGPPGGAARGANVLLLTIDSLRADRLAALPALAALAADSAHFTRAYSPSCWTIHAMTALLSSRLASHLDFTHVGVAAGYQFIPREIDDGMLQNPAANRKVTPVPLGDTRPTLATLLRDAGYQTATVVSYIFYFRGAGVTRGFEVVDEDAYRALQIDGAGITAVPMVDRAEHFLAARDQDRPFFLWLHFMEPHAPYRARDEAARGGDHQARYDSELRFVDREIDRLLTGLEQRGLLEDTLVIVHADHGEEFGDHGGQFHATTLYEEIIQVPLLLKLPARSGLAPARFDTPVSLLDLAPTLLDLLGVTTDAPLAGRSLLPLLAGEPSTARPVVSECFRFGRRKRAVVVWPHKLIVDDAVGTYQLFDLEADPAERSNLADREPSTLAALAALLRAL
jgi:arylsulfatase A-like enzyme